MLLVICSVCTSANCQRQDVICEMNNEIGHCSFKNLNSIYGEFNFLMNVKWFRELITQIDFKQSNLNKVPSEIFSAYKNLNVLDVSHCNLKQIETNTFKDAINLK